MIRKLNFDQKLLKILLEPITLEGYNDVNSSDNSNAKFEDRLTMKDNKQYEKIVGISDLIFEVIYGAGEGLHSKAREVLEALLNFDRSKKEMVLLIRCVYLKLFNEVDTGKQAHIYDSFVKTLNYREEENDLNIMLLIFKDCIKLKYGKRVSTYGIIQMN